VKTVTAEIAILSKIAAAAFATKETHQQTLDEISDVYAAQSLFLVAVTEHPGLQPFFGSSQSDIQCV
jgi:hypothetical protein